MKTLLSALLIFSTSQVFAGTIVGQGTIPALNDPNIRYFTFGEAIDEAKFDAIAKARHLCAVENKTVSLFESTTPNGGIVKMSTATETGLWEIVYEVECK